MGSNLHMLKDILFLVELTQFLQFLFNTHVFLDLLHGCVDEGGEGGDLGDALRLEALHLQFLKHVHVSRQSGVLVL